MIKMGDRIGQARNWVIQLRDIKEIFKLPEVWLFINFLGLILLWGAFYFFIKSKLDNGDKKNFIAFLIFGSVLTFIGVAFYFIHPIISMTISIIAFSFIILAPSYCAWTLMDLESIKQSFISKLGKKKKLETQK